MQHKVKLAVEVGRGMYVVECVCGWGSPLCGSKMRANDLYADHKAGRAAADHLPAFGGAQVAEVGA